MQSANIPEGPRNPRGYSEEEILHELRGLRGTRKVSFRYEHLDRNLQRIKDLDNVIDGSVKMAYTTSIKRTATFTLNGDGGIDFLHDYIKPWFRLHMPPRVQGERFLFHRNWDNTFTVQDPGPATADTFRESGAEAETIFGEVFHVDSPQYRNQNVLQLGSKVDGAGGYFVTPTMDLSGMLRRFEAFMFFETGAAHQVLWRDELGEFFEDGGGGDVNAGFSVNGQWSQVWLSGTNFGSGVYNQMVDRWVRVEITFNYFSGEVDYKLFWSSPQYGLFPDLHHVAPMYNDQKPHGFELEKWTDGGSHPNAAIYVSRVSFGDIEILPAVEMPTDEDWVEWPLGVFLLSTPTQNARGGVVTRSVEAYDRAKIFTDDKLLERFVIEKGEVYTDVMNRVIDMVDPTFPRIIEPSTWVCGRTREFEVGTEMKEVLDRIAETINYHTMQIDENGVMIYRPYVSPSNRTPEFDYSDNEISIMHDDVDAEFDIYDIANVWIVSLSEADGPPVFVRLENHDPANPFSIPRRGRRIVDYREQEEGVDPRTIMTKAKRIQFEANRVYEGIDFTSLLNPLHGTNDCYTINFRELNIKNKYTETGWTMPLRAGATMSHSARRNVNLDPEMFSGFVDDHLQVDGALTAGNIAWGRILVPITKRNTPLSVQVTGLDLQGSGPVDVLVTADTTVPQNVKAVCSQEESPKSFRIWVHRATLADTWVNWLALRKV